MSTDEQEGIIYDDAQLIKEYPIDIGINTEFIEVADADISNPPDMRSDMSVDEYLDHLRNHGYL